MVIVVVVIIVVLLGALGGWFYYAYSHPTSASGMWLMEVNYLGLVATKPVFGVSDKASFKPVSSATGTS